MRIGSALGVACLVSIVACGAAPSEEETQEPEVMAPPRVFRPIDVAVTPAPDGFEKPARTSGTASLLSDHRGRIVPTMHFYVLYWGAGFEATTPALYETFLRGLGSSSYWAVDTQYLRGATNSASYMRSYTDTSSVPPTVTTDSDLRSELARALATGKLPYDANGLYFVVTPPRVRVCLGTMCSCTDFCGYHSAYSDPRGVVLYSSIPSAAACPRSCGVFSSDATSPNGNVEADEGVSVMAHEAEETQSDAYGNAWFDASGSENADKCAYQYGTTTVAPNGARVNQSWAGKSWLVQMNWSNAAGGCVRTR